MKEKGFGVGDIREFLQAEGKEGLNSLVNMIKDVYNRQK